MLVDIEGESLDAGMVEVAWDAPLDLSSDEVAGPCDSLSDGALCEDGDPCTVADRCESGVCVGGSSRVCDAEGPCRPGVCAPGGACVYEDAEDGVPCAVACFQQANCEEGACRAVPGSEQPCESPDSPCVDELKCDSATGLCTVEIFALTGTICDTDADVCTLESCDEAGSCVDLETKNTCENEASLNPCWTYVCSAKKGCLQTQFVEGASCQDGNACTVSDSCVMTEIGLKTCQGTPLSIDDSNACTDDACVAGVVTHVPLSGAVCPIQHPCSDTGLCAEDVCVPKTECECAVDSDCAVADDPCLGPMVCDTTGDFPVCAQDLSSPVVCPPTGLECQDNQCETGTGACVQKAALAGAACDDQDACTVGDACFGGSCVSSSSLDCDDADVCNGLEICHVKLGCVAGVPLACDDQNSCNGTESCHVLSGCLLGQPLACDDGDVCTGLETCSPATGCLVGVPLTCSDEVHCNGQESCHPVAGCQAGPPPVVDDGVACTIDACDEEKGEVTHTPLDVLCGEGNSCTVGACDATLGCLLSDLPEGAACPGGICASGVCTCQSTCVPGTCGDDGCGGLCTCADGETCSAGVCLGAAGAGWTGTWHVTADPNTQSLGGLGIVSFVPTDVSLVDVNGVLSGDVAGGQPAIQYTGSATPTIAAFSGTFTDASGVVHNEEWEWVLAVEGVATGTLNEELSVFGLPFSLQWNVNATKL